jgi:hypothetical protein
MENAFAFYTREPNRLLPVANVFRVMKSQIPEGAKVAKDAKEVCAFARARAQLSCVMYACVVWTSVS